MCTVAATRRHTVTLPPVRFVEESFHAAVSTVKAEISHQIEPLKVLRSFVSLFLPDGNVTDLLGHGRGFSFGIWRRHRREEKYGWCLSWLWTSSWPYGFKETMNSKLTISTVNHVSVLRLLSDTDHLQCADIVRWWDIVCWCVPALQHVHGSLLTQCRVGELLSAALAVGHIDWSSTQRCLRVERFMCC